MRATFYIAIPIFAAATLFAALMLNAGWPR